MFELDGLFSNAIRGHSDRYSPLLWLYKMLSNVSEEQVDLQCIRGLSCVTARRMSSAQIVSVSAQSANNAGIASQDVRPSYFKI